MAAVVVVVAVCVCAGTPSHLQLCPALPPQHKAVEFATACGAATCTKPGAIGAQPTLAEAEALLAAKGAGGVGG